ncbi:MAG: agmatinase [Methanobacteriota archaeon]
MKKNLARTYCEDVLFADANVGPSEADSVLFGVRYGGTVSFRKGTENGPCAIREESWNFETFHWEHGTDLETSRLFDAGDIGPFKTPEEMASSVGARAKELAHGNFLIMLGGEHSVTSPVVKATGAKAVVVVDAHLDFRDSYHDSKYNHACATRRISEIVGVEGVFPIGVRSICAEEHEDAKRLGLRWATSNDVRTKGIDRVIDDVLAQLKGRPLYLSIDIDGIDPMYAPGTGTPEPWGIASLDAKRIVERLAPELVGMDVVEVCPACDNGNTASLAARLVREALAVRMKSPAKK